MASAIGVIFGLSSLIASILVILNGWHLMSQPLKIAVVIVPSVAGTVAVLALIISVRILACRVYRRSLRITGDDESAFNNSDKWNWLILPIWIVVGLAIYSGLEACCSR